MPKLNNSLLKDEKFFLSYANMIDETSNLYQKSVSQNFSFQIQNHYEIILETMMK